MIQYGDNELQDLGEHYGMQEVNGFKGKVNFQDAEIDTTALRAEWPLFKLIMFEKCLSYRSKVNRDINRAHSENVKAHQEKRKLHTAKVMG